MTKEGDKVRERLLEILSENLPLNTCQVCRLYNGAEHRNDIKFCRDEVKDPWKGKDTYSTHGNLPYKNCKDCERKLPSIWYYLRTLEEQGKAESRLEFRTDPIVRGRKDKMRMWALKGGLPSLKKFMV